MKEPFEKIRINDPDAALTQPSEEAPGFRGLYLKLSDGQVSQVRSFLLRARPKEFRNRYYDNSFQLD